MTSMPSELPTRLPSVFPTTDTPTAMPSLSGWVVTVSASTMTTTKLDDDIIRSYVSAVADFYGVNESDVATAVTYSTSGSLALIIPEESTKEDILDAVTESLADSLDIHPSTIDITVDMDSGEVLFTITSDSYNGAAEVVFELSSDLNKDMIIASIESSIPDLVVSTYAVSEEVEATVTFTVDADDAKEDLTAAAFETAHFFEAEEFDVDVDSITY